MPISNYHRKLDEKRRAFLGNILPDTYQGLEKLVCINYGDHLCLYTENAWEAQQSLLAASFEDSQRDMISNAAEDVSIQSGGKIVIPSSFKYAKPGNKVLVEVHPNFIKILALEKEQLNLGFQAINAPLAFGGKKAIGKKAQKLPLSHINLNDDTFCNRSDLGNLKLLRKSIGDVGQIVPIIVRGSKPPYQVISGFRRLECLKALKASFVLADVREKLSDRDADMISLTENSQREGLPICDLLKTLKSYKDKGYNTTELSYALGKGKRIVEQYLQVWNGPESIKKALEDKRISITGAIKAVSKNLDVEEIENKSIRHIEREVTKDKGPVRFREFGTGKITLKMRFMPDEHKLDDVITELENVIVKLKERKNEKSEGNNSSDTSEE